MLPSFLAKYLCGGIMVKYDQGKFRPLNPWKYKGDPTNIIYRSSWERLAMQKLDKNPNVLQWSSEETIIPYRSPLDGKMHRYFVDLYVKIKVDDKVHEYLIEIKPEAETKPPQKPKMLSEGYIRKVQTFAVNTYKWEAAKKYAELRGMKFEVWTEKTLGIKK